MITILWFYLVQLREKILESPYSVSISIITDGQLIYTFVLNPLIYLYYKQVTDEALYRSYFYLSDYFMLPTIKPIVTYK